MAIALGRDKSSGAPNGSAYVWFQRRKEADFASECACLPVWDCLHVCVWGGGLGADVECEAEGVRVGEVEFEAVR